VFLYDPRYSYFLAKSVGNFLIAASATVSATHLSFNNFSISALVALSFQIALIASATLSAFHLSASLIVILIVVGAGLAREDDVLLVGVFQSDFSIICLYIGIQSASFSK